MAYVGSILPLKTVWTVAKYEPMGTIIMAAEKPRSLKMTSLARVVRNFAFNWLSQPIRYRGMERACKSKRGSSLWDGRADVGLFLSGVILFQDCLFRADNAASGHCWGCRDKGWWLKDVGWWSRRDEDKNEFSAGWDELDGALATRGSQLRTLLRNETGARPIRALVCAWTIPGSCSSYALSLSLLFFVVPFVESFESVVTAFT